MPHEKMNRPNSQNRWRKGMFWRLRAYQTSTIGMAQYAPQMARSDRLWSRTSPGDHPPHVNLVPKPSGSNSLRKNSIVSCMAGREDT